MVLVLSALLATPCRADQWLPPQAETYQSSDATYRLHIQPRAVISGMAYFSDKLKHREPAGTITGQRQTTATAAIEHLAADGQWITVWSGPLTNEVAPVDALITDGGRYVVTFDNWHSTGYGPNAVAILDGHGHVIRSLALKDIVSDDYIYALPHSISSIVWRGQARFGPDQTLIIPIRVPDGSQPGDDGHYVDAIVRLSDGAVLSGKSPDWLNANAVAAKQAQQKRDFEEKEKQAFFAPLLGPAENTELAWHQYLMEAFFRAAPQWKDQFPSITVLRDPSAPDYAKSEQELRDMLLDHGALNGPMSFASIASFDYFLARTGAILADAKPGCLKGATVTIVAPTSALPILKPLFAPTGADVVVLDPTVPIPQRPERLKEYLSSNS